MLERRSSKLTAEKSSYDETSLELPGLAHLRLKFTTVPKQVPETNHPNLLNSVCSSNSCSFSDSDLSATNLMPNVATPQIRSRMIRLNLM
jgi:hypothetical protein